MLPQKEMLARPRAGWATRLFLALAVLLGASQLMYLSVWRVLLEGGGAAGSAWAVRGGRAVSEALADEAQVGKDGNLNGETGYRGSDSARWGVSSESLFGRSRQSIATSDALSPPLDSPSAQLSHSKAPNLPHSVHDQADGFPDDPSRFPNASLINCFTSACFATRTRYTAVLARWRDSRQGRTHQRLLPCSHVAISHDYR